MYMACGWTGDRHVIIRRVLENKFAFVAIVLAFALALGLNAAYGSVTTTSAPDQSLLSVEPTHLADGPSISPDPWAGFADGPSISPDPWAGFLLADGPSISPDPWAGFADGPSISPDPWAGFSLVADGPSISPDPWAGFADGPSISPDPWAGFQRSDSRTGSVTLG